MNLGKWVLTKNPNIFDVLYIKLKCFALSDQTAITLNQWCFKILQDWEFSKPLKHSLFLTGCLSLTIWAWLTTVFGEQPLDFPGFAKKNCFVYLPLNKKWSKWNKKFCGRSLVISVYCRIYSASQGWARRHNTVMIGDQEWASVYDWDICIHINTSRMLSNIKQIPPYSTQIC